MKEIVITEEKIINDFDKKVDEINNLLFKDISKYSQSQVSVLSLMSILPQIVVDYVLNTYKDEEFIGLNQFVIKVPVYNISIYMNKFNDKNNEDLKGWMYSVEI